MSDERMGPPWCEWCRTVAWHDSPADHTPDGRYLFVEDALRKSREDSRKRYPGFHAGLRESRQFRWSYDSRGRMVL